jgi:hypothetical protein
MSNTWNLEKDRFTGAGHVRSTNNVLSEQIASATIATRCKSLLNPAC